jgi:hypothetical protein
MTTITATPVSHSTPRDLSTLGRLTVDRVEFCQHVQGSEYTEWANLDEYNDEPLSELLGNFKLRGYKSISKLPHGLGSGYMSLLGCPYSAFLHFKSKSGSHLYTVCASTNQLRIK